MPKLTRLQQLSEMAVYKSGYPKFVGR